MYSTTYTQNTTDPRDVLCGYYRGLDNTRVYINTKSEFTMQKRLWCICNWMLPVCHTNTRHKIVNIWQNVPTAPNKLILAQLWTLNKHLKHHTHTHNNINFTLRTVHTAVSLWTAPVSTSHQPSKLRTKLRQYKSTV